MTERQVYLQSLQHQQLKPAAKQAIDDALKAKNDAIDANNDLTDEKKLLRKMQKPKPTQRNKPSTTRPTNTAVEQAKNDGTTSVDSVTQRR